eukprot:1157624-Pelagomonas_calceolata.AAC.19
MPASQPGFPALSQSNLCGLLVSRFGCSRRLLVKSCSPGYNWDVKGHGMLDLVSMALTKHF